MPDDNSTLTPQQFMSLVRKRYPGAYPGADDNQVAWQIVQQYPTYGKRLRFSQIPKDFDLIAAARQRMQGASIGASHTPVAMADPTRLRNSLLDKGNFDQIFPELAGIPFDQVQSYVAQQEVAHGAPTLDPEKRWYDNVPVYVDAMGGGPHGLAAALTSPGTVVHGAEHVARAVGLPEFEKNPSGSLLPVTHTRPREFAPDADQPDAPLVSFGDLLLPRGWAYKTPNRAASAAEAFTDIASNLTTPSALALLAASGGLSAGAEAGTEALGNAGFTRLAAWLEKGKPLQRGLALFFAGQTGRALKQEYPEIKEQWTRAMDSTDPQQRFRLLTMVDEAVLNATMGGLSAAELARGESPIDRLTPWQKAPGERFAKAREKFEKMNQQEVRHGEVATLRRLGYSDEEIAKIETRRQAQRAIKRGPKAAAAPSPEPAPQPGPEPTPIPEAPAGPAPTPAAAPAPLPEQYGELDFLRERGRFLETQRKTAEQTLEEIKEQIRRAREAANRDEILPELVERFHRAKATLQAIMARFAVNRRRLETLVKQEYAKAKASGQAGPQFIDVERSATAAPAEGQFRGQQHVEAPVASGFTPETAYRAAHGQQGALAPPAPEAAPEPAPAPAGEASEPEAATYEPGKQLQGLGGAETTLRTPGGDFPTRYRVVEGSQLIPSHNPYNFRKNPNYPIPEVQQRQYDLNKAAQTETMRYVAEGKWDLFVNGDPTGQGGPPQITPDGVVLGGNGRTMALQRAYREGAPGEAYKRYLVEHAGQYGIDAQQVIGMEHPVLVREFQQPPKNIDELRRLGASLNEKHGKELTAEEEAVTAGANFSVDSARKISSRLAETDASLRELMASDPKLFWDSLTSDGILNDRNVRKYFTDARTLNEAGKNFVENMMLGSVVKDPKMLAEMPKAVKAKFVRSLPSLIELSHREDAWNITPQLLSAVRYQMDATGKGLAVDEYLKQMPIFEQPDWYNQVLMRFLQRNPTEVAEGFEGFAQQARMDVAGQGRLLGSAPHMEREFSRWFTGPTESEMRVMLSRLRDLDKLATSQGRTLSLPEVKQALQTDSITAKELLKRLAAAKRDEAAVHGLPEPVSDEQLDQILGETSPAADEAELAVPFPPGTPTAAPAAPPSSQQPTAAGENAGPLGVSAFIKQDVRPGLHDALANVVQSADHIQTMFAPATRGPHARMAKNVVREHNASLAADMDRSITALEEAAKTVGHMSRENRLKFIDMSESGKPFRDAKLQGYSDLMQKMLHDTWAEVQKRRGTDIWIENFFPHFWKPVEGLGEIINRVYGRRPLEGTKSFFHKRSIPTVREGLALRNPQTGKPVLDLVTDNPVDLTLMKLYEMRKYIMGHDIMADLKQRGLLHLVQEWKGDKAPAGYRRIDDASGTVYGNPIETHWEAYDEIMMRQLEGLLRQLDIGHARKLKLKQAGAAGVAYMKGANRIETRFGGPESVITHELGHILDDRYGLAKGWAQDKETVRQLSELAKLRYQGAALPDDHDFAKYVQQPSERVANLLHAFIHAPELLHRVAPRAELALREMIRMHPELRPLLEIKPSLRAGDSSIAVRTPGLRVMGHYYAPEPVATLVNNFLSPGLAKYPVYRMARYMTNSMNMLQLGLSYFHALMTGLEAAVSKGAVGVHQLSRGKFLAAADSFARANLFVAPWEYYHAGKRIQQAHLKPGSMGDGFDATVHAVVAAGGRFRADRIYETGAAERFMKALRSGNYPGAVLRAVPAAVEAIAKPLMDIWVPRLKLGAFADLARQMVMELPKDASQEMVREALSKSWDSIDNRFGQLIYDNLFWNRTLKDTALLATRSLGWNLGSLREIGGGVTDIPKAVFSRGPLASRVTTKIAHLVALPVVIAIHGAMLQYLLTGQAPQSIKDYYFPRTGKINPDGTPERLSLPSYMKDIYEYARQPFTTLAHKASPEVGAAIEMLNNKDYYGTEVRNPDDPLVKQLGEEFHYMEGQFVPFSERNLEQRAQTEHSSPLKELATAKGLESFVGIVPAPRSVDRTAAQEYSSEITAGKIPAAPRTQVSADKSRLRREIAEKLRRRDPGGAAQLRVLMRQGTLDQNDLRVIEDMAFHTDLVRQVRSMTLPQALHVWDVANASERIALRPVILGKASGVGNLPVADRPAVMAKIREIQGRTGAP